MVDHSEHGIDLLEPLPTTFAGWQNAEVEDDGSADGAAATARPRRRSRSDSLNGRDQQQPMQLDLIPPAAPLAAASAAHRVSSPDALASTESSSSAASASAASGDNTSSSDAASTASAGSSSPQHPFSSSSSADDRDADAHSRNGEPGSSGSAAESKEEDHGTQQQGKRACLAVHLSDSQRHLPIKRSDVQFCLTCRHASELRVREERCLLADAKRLESLAGYLPERNTHFYPLLHIGRIECRVHRLFNWTDEHGRLVLIFERAADAKRAADLLSSNSSSGSSSKDSKDSKEGTAAAAAVGPCAMTFRFCGKHRRVHPISAFEGSNRSCRPEGKKRRSRAAATAPAATAAAAAAVAPSESFAAARGNASAATPAAAASAAASSSLNTEWSLLGQPIVDSSSPLLVLLPPAAAVVSAAASGGGGGLAGQLNVFAQYFTAQHPTMLPPAAEDSKSGPSGGCFYLSAQGHVVVRVPAPPPLPTLPLSIHGPSAIGAQEAGAGATAAAATVTMSIPLPSSAIGGGGTHGSSSSSQTQTATATATVRAAPFTLAVFFKQQLVIRCVCGYLEDGSPALHALGRPPQQQRRYSYSSSNSSNNGGPRGEERKLLPATADKGTKRKEAPTKAEEEKSRPTKRGRTRHDGGQPNEDSEDSTPENKDNEDSEADEDDDEHKRHTLRLLLPAAPPLSQPLSLADYLSRAAAGGLVLLGSASSAAASGAASAGAGAGLGLGLGLLQARDDLGQQPSASVGSAVLLGKGAAAAFSDDAGAPLFAAAGVTPLELESGGIAGAAGDPDPDAPLLPGGGRPGQDGGSCCAGNGWRWLAWLLLGVGLTLVLLALYVHLFSTLTSGRAAVFVAGFLLFAAWTSLLFSVLLHPLSPRALLAVGVGSLGFFVGLAVVQGELPPAPMSPSPVLPPNLGRCQFVASVAECPFINQIVAGPGSQECPANPGYVSAAAIANVTVQQASDETGDIMALIGLLPNLAESQGFPWSSDQQNACAAAFRIFICNLLIPSCDASCRVRLPCVSLCRDLHTSCGSQMMEAMRALAPHSSLRYVLQDRQPEWKQTFDLVLQTALSCGHGHTSARDQCDGVVPKPPRTQLEQNTPMVARLVSGRVELSVNASWMTVCYNGTAAAEAGSQSQSQSQSSGSASAFAAVVCRQLGLGGGRFLDSRTIYPGDLYAGSIALPACNGSEPNVLACKNARVPADCGHESDMGVECALSPPTAVLSSPPYCSADDGTTPIAPVTDNDPPADLSAYLANNRSTPFCGAATTAYFIANGDGDGGSASSASSASATKNDKQQRHRWETAGTALSALFVALVLLVPPVDMWLQLRQSRRKHSRGRVTPRPRGGFPSAAALAASDDDSEAAAAALAPAGLPRSRSSASQAQQQQQQQQPPRANALDIWTFVGPKGIAFALIELAVGCLLFEVSFRQSGHPIWSVLLLLISLLRFWVFARALLQWPSAVRSRSEWVRAARLARAPWLLKQGMLAQRWYAERFGVNGTHYYEKAHAVEILEVAVQIWSAFTLAPTLDSWQLFVLVAAVSVNMVLAGLLSLSRSVFWRRDVSVVCDVVIDHLYIVFQVWVQDLGVNMNVSGAFSIAIPAFLSALRMMALCDDAICNQWRKYRAKLQQQQPMAPDSGSVSVSPRSAWRQQQLQPSASEAAGIEASRAQAVLKARHGCHRAFDIFFGVSFAALGAAFFVSALTLTATQHAHCQDAVSEAVWSRASPKVFWPDGLLFWSPRCDFAAVHQLSLSGAGLQTLLPSIALLSQLENLTISDNQLTALPLELGNIASLRRLDARDNLIANLPAALAAQWSERSRPLQQLLLDGNPAAEYLDWSFSGLRSVPTVVTQLADTLRSLSLRGNDLTSFESSTLLKLSLLEQLDISQNRIPQVPVAIVPSLPAMRVFNASDAGLTDTLPDNLLFSQWLHLRTLDLSRNGKLRLISAEVSQLDPAVDVILRGNDQIQLLQWDRHAMLRVTPAIGQLTGLQVVGLTYNQLSSLPDELALCTNIRALYLSFNRMSALPLVLTRIPTISELFIKGNQLTSLPAELATMSGLEALDAEMNQFASMPRSLSLLLRNGSLAALRIAGNPFVSSPPASFAIDGKHDGAFSNATGSRCASTEVPGQADEMLCGVTCRATPAQGLIALNASSVGTIASTVFHRDAKSVLQFAFHLPYNVSRNGTVAVYQRNQRCDWTLRAPPGFVVAVRFSFIDLATASLAELNSVGNDVAVSPPSEFDQCVDHVRLFDGDSDQAPLLKTGFGQDRGDLCGRWPRVFEHDVSAPAPDWEMASTGRDLHVSFGTNFEQEAEGFVMEYRVKPA